MAKHKKDVDCGTDIGRTIHLTFNPSKNFAEENVILFGITIVPQRRKLIIITKIYEEDRRDEIVNKLGIMANVMMMTIPSSRTGVDNIHIVDQKDILIQISKNNVDKFSGSIYKEQDLIVETIDLITGEMVPVEFSMKLLKIEKNR
jgi:hypothetical protein